MAAVIDMIEGLMIRVEQLIPCVRRQWGHDRFAMLPRRPTM